MTPKHISIWDARVNLTDFILRASYKKERFVIEKHGKPLALLVPIEDIPILSPTEIRPVSPMSKLKVFETER